MVTENAMKTQPDNAFSDVGLIAIVPDAEPLHNANECVINVTHTLIDVRL